MKRVLASWALLAAVYLLFAGQVSATEAAAGVGVSLLCALIAQALTRAGERHFSGAAPWARLFASVGAGFAIDPLRVAAAIVRGGGGHVDRQPFRPGGHDQAARRALVTLATSVAPNGIVTAVEQDALVVHRLYPTPARRDRDWPL